MRTTIGADWFALSVWPCFAFCGDDRARHRRVDLGVVQVRFVAAQRRARLLDLRLEHVDLRLRRLRSAASAVCERVLRRRVLAHHVLLALELLLGERELRFAVGELRLLRAQLRAIRVDAREIDGRIDLGEELALP